MLGNASKLHVLDEGFFPGEMFRWRFGRSETFKVTGPEAYGCRSLVGWVGSLCDRLVCSEMPGVFCDRSVCFVIPVIRFCADS